MKKLIFILTFAMLAIGACKKEMDITPAIQVQPAKYPGVLAALTARFRDVVAAPHINCFTAEMDVTLNTYFTGLAEFTPNEYEVGMSFDHSDDIARITFHEVTYEFYKDGTTNWDRETWPGQEGVPELKTIPTAELDK